MKHIKGINENFDDVDIKKKVSGDPDLEIKNIKGEVGKDALSWLRMGKAKDETTSLKRRLLFKYPVFDVLHSDKIEDDKGDTYCFYGVSYDSSKGDYYAQFCFSVERGGSIISAHTLLKDLNNDDEKSFVFSDDIMTFEEDKFFKFVNNFLDICIKHGIINKKDKRTILDN